MLTTQEKAEWSDFFSVQGQFIILWQACSLATYKFHPEISEISEISEILREFFNVSQSSRIWILLICPKIPQSSSCLQNIWATKVNHASTYFAFKEKGIKPSSVWPHHVLPSAIVREKTPLFWPWSSALSHQSCSVLPGREQEKIN